MELDIGNDLLAQKNEKVHWFLVCWNCFFGMICWAQKHSAAQCMIMS